MTQPEARSWIKQNWSRLANSGQLGEAITRYLGLKDSLGEIDEEKTAVTSVLDSDKSAVDFFGSPLDD